MDQNIAKSDNWTSQALGDTDKPHHHQVGPYIKFATSSQGFLKFCLIAEFFYCKLKLSDW
jgi:hypothetical protein